MESKTVILILDRPARKGGGDRYTGKCEGEDLSIYFPQSISRSIDGKPVEAITIAIKLV